MRKVVARLAISLDGVVEAPSLGKWLVDSRTLSTGVVSVTYQPARG